LPKPFSSASSAKTVDGWLPAGKALSAVVLEHDPEKGKPVFPRDKRENAICAESMLNKGMKNACNRNAKNRSDELT
jgi:hypothetical protein